MNFKTNTHKMSTRVEENSTQSFSEFFFRTQKLFNDFQNNNYMRIWILDHKLCRHVCENI